MLARPPLLSIITVVYNGAYYLNGTARSVLAQTYPHIEYIIVDGGSTDHTPLAIQLIELGNEKLLNAKILRWISEPDKGLYDAMNKGLRMATGDFVWFLNAGDELPDATTVEKMMLKCGPETDVIFGETTLVTFTRHPLGTRSQLTTQKLPIHLTWESLRQGMVVCHQAFVARRAITPNFIEGNLAADIDWVIEVLKKSRQNLNSGLILANYLTGGVSKQRHRQSLKDRYVVLKKHYGFLPNVLAHCRIVMRSLFTTNSY
ncbi:MAG: glycosyltransferase [Saprospiraceae bacterium]|nr:glycosyltransferase [Saprospiraceae bacterium]MCF8248505.1 glycosyltransferase [Saprospiraceae bacterium]MCF8280576.1 glycosyltransferase [Bacteroidales bacterium]MCF8310239.1 glycosyltransferase [Saprospiraceae bacterium]MCF8439322.1 glycosyltransferase [Saprospiraceae bacterium]